MKLGWNAGLRAAPSLVAAGTSRAALHGEVAFGWVHAAGFAAHHGAGPAQVEALAVNLVDAMDRLNTELAGAMAARVDRQSAELPLATAIDFTCIRRPALAAALLTALAGEGLTGTTAFEVLGRGRYQVHIHDAFGFVADPPATFIIDPTENEPPQVAILRPAAVHQVTSAVAAVTAVSGAREQVLVLTTDRAISAAAVERDGEGRIVPLRADGVRAEPIPPEKLVLVRYAPPPRRDTLRVWVCLADGQRLSGSALESDARCVRLAGNETPIPLERISAIFFNAARPGPVDPPEDGVRVIRDNGDVLLVPLVEMTPQGVLIDLDPAIDPVILPLHALHALVWPAPGGPPEAAEDLQMICLRGGERFLARITAWNGVEISAEFGTQRRALPVRELAMVWFRARGIIPVEQFVPEPAAGNDRPVYRPSRSALNSALRIGQRVYAQGIGLRGPAQVELDVPGGAAWFLADAGAHAGAAPFARVRLSVWADGAPRADIAAARPGDPPRTLAVPLGGVRTLTLRVESAGDDPTGCLGDFGDALFVK